MSEFAVTKYYGCKRQLPRPYIFSWYFSPINSFYTSTFLQHYYLKKNDVENELTANEEGNILCEENSKENICASEE